MRTPMPPELRDSLVPEPSMGVVMFRFDLCPPAVVKEATEFIYNKESCSELKRAFREDWVRRHLTHMHSDAPELHFPKGKVAGQGVDHDCSPCWVAGKCICSIAGVIMKHALCSVMAAWKVAFPFNGSDRKQLAADGWVVCHLVGSVAAGWLAI